MIKMGQNIQPIEVKPTSEVVQTIRLYKREIWRPPFFSDTFTNYENDFSKLWGFIIITTENGVVLINIIKCLPGDIVCKNCVKVLQIQKYKWLCQIKAVSLKKF